MGRKDRAPHVRDISEKERHSRHTNRRSSDPYNYQDIPYGYTFDDPRHVSKYANTPYAPQYPAVTNPYRNWNDCVIYTGQPQYSTSSPDIRHGYAHNQYSPYDSQEVETRPAYRHTSKYDDQYHHLPGNRYYDASDNSGAESRYDNKRAGNVNRAFVHDRYYMGKVREMEDMYSVEGDIEDRVNGDVRHETDKMRKGRSKTRGHKDKKPSILKRISNGITQGLERFFYNVGLVVAKNVKKTIAACVIIPLLLAIGFVKFKQDEDFAALLIPLSSRIPGEIKWIDDHMPFEFRGVSFIVEDENILSSKSVNAMLSLYKASLDIRVDGYDYTDFCSGVNNQCVVNSLLDLWRYNETVIQSMTDQDVLDTINTTTVNPTYFTEFRADKILGHITRDENGRITGARAALMLWSLILKPENEKEVRKFELKMVDLGRKGHADLDDVFVLYKDAFDDEFFSAVYDDVFLLIYGFPLVLLYMNLAFGKPNMVEHRFLLVFAGLAGVLLSACVCYGICLAAGLKFGVTHQALMFLLLAIGVDDSFVIMEAWKRVEKQHPKESLEVKMAITMKHAGVSITVTSISDTAAFAVGISTVMPILSSFCVYSAVGIIALYILQATLFPACLILDQRRIEERRDGLIPCYVHKNWQPNRHSNKEFVEPFFKKIFGPIILSIPGKVIVIIITLGLAGTMMWSLTTIDKGFVLEEALEKTSFARQFLAANTKYYPDAGFAIDFYCDKMDYSKNAVQLELMTERLKNSSGILEGTTLSWVVPFKMWLNQLKANGENLTLSSEGYPTTNFEFGDLLYRFTHMDKSGVAFKDLIFISNDTREVQFVIFRASLDYIDKPSYATKNEASMDAARAIADESDTDATCFAFGQVFVFVEVIKYVDVELLRNFILASVCVFVVTLLLIVDIRTSFLVLVCVVFVTVGLGGTFSFIGFSMDGNMVILLTFSIGLAVDFSAHIGYMFMTVLGTKDERAQKALNNMGPAVWHGAFSTFLGFVALAFAKSFSLHLFFLTFATVVAFGLFQGLCFLPVMLSIIGPPPYDDAELDIIGVMDNFEQREQEIYSLEKDVHIPRPSITNL